MKTIASVGDLRAACDEVRRAGGTVGFVPTMGYFHEGHVSLMRAARASHEFVVTSIFVNPLQFGAHEDLDAYPRDLERDAAAALAAGVDALFVPTVAEMYPGGAPRTTVHVAGLSEVLCGVARPGHFDGVTTVCAKLFSIVGPASVYMGRKDFQQWLVVRRMAADLNLPVVVVGASLVREADGLAMSSRNAYLGPDDRAAATVLFRALRAAVTSVEKGDRSAASVVATVAAEVRTEPRIALEYCEIRSIPDLEAVTDLAGEVLVAVAARAGNTRLIDNVVLDVQPDNVTADLGTIGG